MGLVEGQLLVQAGLIFTQGHDAPPNRDHTVTNRQVDAFNKGRIDVLIVRRCPCVKVRMGGGVERACGRGSTARSHASQSTG
jgi:hypothetical protein